MNEKDVSSLRNAVAALEFPTVSTKIAALLGAPVQKSIHRLPDKAQETIGTAVEKAVHGALLLALKTLDQQDRHREAAAPKGSDFWHKVAVATTGAAGGAFGLTALAIELPVSTTIMMRSIADIARREGADLQDIRTQLECVQVLALGVGPNRAGSTEMGYFVAREALTKAVSEAAAHLAQRGLQRESAPAIARLVTAIAERYSITVTEKFAAQLLPVIGGIGGASINSVFMDHFQKMAHAHFMVRRLEREYGEDLVRQKYQELFTEARRAKGGIPEPA
jgi:hypothetical protein